MGTWIQTVITTRTDIRLKVDKLTGLLGDGIVILPVKDVNKLGLSDDQLSTIKQFRVLLLVDRDLVEMGSKTKTKNAYRNLTHQITIFLRIFHHPDLTILRIGDIDSASITSPVFSKKRQISSHWWKLFLEQFEERKMSFRLFSLSISSNLKHPMLNVLYSVIALESILLKGEKQESAYKFRIRGAFLIGRIPERRRKYYQILKYAYELRSAIVHSNEKERVKIRAKIKVELGLNTTEFNRELTKINRMLIKGMIKKPDIFNQLDNLIIDNSLNTEQK